MAKGRSAREDAWRSLFHAFVEPEARRKKAALDAAVVATRPRADRRFSFFRAADQSAALRLADEFDGDVGRDPRDRHARHHGKRPTEAALKRVMRRFHARAASEPELAKWALRIFIARSPNADVLPMPTLRQQLAHLKSRQPEKFADMLAAAALPGAAAGEDNLRYFRQDLDLSDHHLHWHALYQFSDPIEGLQGRLFLFMHQQLLARYNTERFAAGLPLVEPFLQWDKPSAWRASFDLTTLPKDALAPWIAAAWIRSGEVDVYEDFDDQGRSPLQNAGADAVDQVLSGLQRVYDGIAAGNYASYDAIGADLEASSPAARQQGGPHNNGHVVLAQPPGDQQKQFVMISPEVAMTTPVFYRWHRAIDDFGWAWQQAQGTDKTSYIVPPVTLRRGDGRTRSPDVILTPRRAITGIDQSNFDLDAWGTQQFGEPFDRPPAAGFDLDELTTRLVPDPDIAGLPILSIAADWVYFLRLRNDGDQDASVTIRIWLAALALAKDRRNWIEMDKFVVEVPQKTHRVVGRGSWQSTVIRRKSVNDPMTLASTLDEYDDNPAENRETMWCECGLPYRLLLPRGTPEGMPSRFLVLLTDAAQDGTAPQLEQAECGSVTFCGRTDDVWPDRQEMGFPFNRPFPDADDPVFAHFDAMPNAAWRDVSIKST